MARAEGCRLTRVHAKLIMETGKKAQWDLKPRPSDYEPRPSRLRRFSLSSTVRKSLAVTWFFSATRPSLEQLVRRRSAAFVGPILGMPPTLGFICGSTRRGHCEA
jgi:hypothetical protein